MDFGKGDELFQVVRLDVFGTRARYVMQVVKKKASKLVLPSSHSDGSARNPPTVGPSRLILNSGGRAAPCQGGIDRLVG